MEIDLADFVALLMGTLRMHNKPSIVIASKIYIDDRNPKLDLETTGNLTVSLDALNFSYIYLYINWDSNGLPCIKSKPGGIFWHCKLPLFKYDLQF